MARRFLFIGILILPYFLSVPLVDPFSPWNLDFSEFSWALKNSLIQAFGSATLATLMGIVGAFAIVTSPTLWLQNLLILPSLLPVIFIIITLLTFYPQFPMGLNGIIIAHSVISFGLVAGSLAEGIRKQLGRLAEVALVLGIKRTPFLIKVAIPTLRNEITYQFLFVFAGSFASFTVPLFLGGGTQNTLEILIYEKMRTETNWTYPFMISLFQSLLIFFFITLKLKPKLNHPYRGSPFYRFRYDLIYIPGLRFSFYLLISVFFIFYAKAVFLGFNQDPNTLFNFFTEAYKPFLNTIWIGILTGILTMLFLAFVAYCFPDFLLERFLQGFIAPSSALACFGFLLWGPNIGLGLILKIAVLFSTLFLGSLARLGLLGRLDQLRRQISVAHILGANKFLVFVKIIFPQISFTLFWLGGLAGTWAAGDFAITKILARNDFTLALQVRALLHSYHIEAAGSVSFLLLVVCFLVFLLFYGVGRVVDSKFKF